MLDSFADLRIDTVYHRREPNNCPINLRQGLSYRGEVLTFMGPLDPKRYIAVPRHHHIRFKCWKLWRKTLLTTEGKINMSS